MQAARGLSKILLRPTASSSGSISSVSHFWKQFAAAIIVDSATFTHSAIISSSPPLCQFQIVCRATTLRRGERWSPAAVEKKLRSAEQLQLLLLDAVPRRSASTVTTSKAGHEGKKWRFSAIILFLPCAATFGLGTWQLFRRQWKMDVLDYRRKRLEEEPIPLIDAVSAPVEVAKQDDKIMSSSKAATKELEFRTVICEGVYDVKRNLYVGPRARSAFGVTRKGYFVITPLVRAEDSKSGQVPVLVNRGWVPSDWVDEDAGHAVAISAQATDLEKVPWWQFWRRQQNELDKKMEISSRTEPTVTVQGVVRGSEDPNIFVPSNVPSTGQWFYIDVPAMACALGLPENTKLIEVLKGHQQSAGKETFPVAKDREALLHSSVMPDDHLNYALTWYSLSAATTFMAVKRVWGSRGKR